MPNEYYNIHVICLLFSPTETVWLVPVWYKIIVGNNVLTLACITYLSLKWTTKPIVIGELECCLMITGTENNKFSHKHNII